MAIPKKKEIELAKKSRAKLLAHHSRFKGTMDEFAALYDVTPSRIYARLRKAKHEQALSKRLAKAI